MRDKDRLVAAVLGIVMAIILLWLAFSSVFHLIERVSHNVALEAQREEAIIQDIPERPRPSKKD